MLHLTQAQYARALTLLSQARLLTNALPEPRPDLELVIEVLSLVVLWRSGRPQDAELHANQVAKAAEHAAFLSPTCVKNLLGIIAMGQAVVSLSKKARDPLSPCAALMPQLNGLRILPLMQEFCRDAQKGEWLRVVQSVHFEQLLLVSCLVPYFSAESPLIQTADLQGSTNSSQFLPVDESWPAAPEVLEVPEPASPGVFRSLDISSVEATPSKPLQRGKRRGRRASIDIKTQYQQKAEAPSFVPFRHQR